VHIDSQGTCGSQQKEICSASPPTTPVTHDTARKTSSCGRSINHITSAARRAGVRRRSRLASLNGRNGSMRGPSAEVRDVRILTTYTDRSGHVWSVLRGPCRDHRRRRHVPTARRELDAGDYRIIREDMRGCLARRNDWHQSFIEWPRGTVHGTIRVPLRRVTAIIQIRRRRLWIATTAGIFSSSRMRCTKSAVDSRTGLRTSSTTNPMAWRRP